MKLKDKVALVTGASSGIGKAIAESFAREGAFVVLTAKHLAKLKNVENKIKLNNGKAHSMLMDATNRKQIKTSIEKIIKKFKKIDILVNNAGIAIWNPIQEVTDKEFDDHININLIGYYNCIKAVLPYMLKRKSGTIINIISGSGKAARKGSVAYAASKFGSAGLSDAVFEDVKDKGINVTALYPGKTNTPIHDKYFTKEERKKFLKPEDVANLALYVAALPSNVKIKEVSIRPLD
ncbi:SDR family oxidoreductase [Candidatus Woesearchaeota archaeon]|nr:SDR family oxidoreductase [Candidatus Woesearchaeota archaeon]